jgi:5-methylthioribose kinase
MLDDDNLLEYLAGVGFAGSEAGFQPRVEAAGQGNINFVRRVRLERQRSVIVKHARPTLERFPQYRATTERLAFEHRYARSVEQMLSDREPVPARIFHFDPVQHVLVLEDLGDAPQLGSALDAHRPPLAALRQLGNFLARVHTRSAARAAELSPEFENREMQELHGEHIFALPFEPDAFPLPAKTRATADRLLSDAQLRDRIAALREIYYETREALVHADVQSSNVLLQGERPRLLDHELAHFGDPAFDVGTVLAHVNFHIAVEPDYAPFRAAADALLEGYAEGGGSEAVLARAPGHAGVEMLRRTIGAARLPLAEAPSRAQRVLERGAQLIRSAAL